MRRLLFIGLVLGVSTVTAQVEHVPLAHPVYEYLDRLGVRGVLPLHSSTMIPLERGATCSLLDSVLVYADRLTPTELLMARKFRRELDERAGSREDIDLVLLGSQAGNADLPCGLVSDKEKYLYAYVDSQATFRVDLLASAEYRAMHGDTRGTADVMLKTIGGRFQGTIARRLGYYLQSTNGVMSGNRGFGLSDPRLSANVKLNELKTANFDFTEAYLRLGFDWAGIQFGREFAGVGTGYGDRLLLSDNAPVFDYFSVTARYRSFRFLFLHAALLPATYGFQGLDPTPIASPAKFLALHRFQFSLWERANIGVSEMVIYQRVTPEYAYLNPINFYKSSEHQLRDRDNALLAVDLEIFPCDNWKFYGTLLIDDIDFSKLGTGTWGNQFGWQGGVYRTAVAGLNDVDLFVEYTRVEPYVYSNRIAGNDYTHNNIVLGHHVPPNADQILIEGRWAASRDIQLRAQLSYQRHGKNIMTGDSLVRNVGGSALQGHRYTDPVFVTFLDGAREETARAQLFVNAEPIRNIRLVARTGISATYDRTTSTRKLDLSLAFGVYLDY